MRPLLDKLQISTTNDGLFARGWKPGRGQTLTSINPTTGQPIATVTMATAEQSDDAVTAAAAAFETWRTRPAPKRGDLIRDLGAALREMKEPLGDLVTLEMGKIRAEGHGEVQEMIDICDFAVGLSRQLYGLTLASERPGHRMMEQWHPLGPIGVITAFNFPVAVWAWNAAIAAVCGDPVVWKPAEATPLCAIAVQKIAERVTRDHGADGLFGLAIGTGPTVGERLLQDRRLPLISFTGSTAVGRHVARTVSERFGRTILELGGNNAIVVTEDARLDLALRAIVFGSVGTAGQRCTTTRRLIVDKKIAEPLTAKLKQAYEQVPMGDPLDNGTLMGPLVNEAAVDGMMKAIELAKADGGVVVTGGKRRPDVGPFFVEPTIIRMPAQTDVVKRETFAPILYVMDYDTFDQAMTLHNDVPQGLSSAIFTESMRVAEAFLSARGSDCGIANVNIGTSGAEIGGAFGGEKETGGGRESGSDAWKAYMRRQTNTVNWSDSLPLAQGIKFGE
ncbi:MAG TPA: aldehyde dehydrogenase family protein [Vicinamibacterales bacterium]|nr:aldehyde dehydrogenase family protein [Vicinamibacterales bacterium]